MINPLCFLTNQQNNDEEKTIYEQLMRLEDIAFTNTYSLCVHLLLRKGKIVSSVVL